MHSQPGFRGIPAAGPSTSSSWWCLPRKAKNPTLLTVNLPYITCLASSHTFTTFHLVTVFLHPKSGSNVLRLQHGMAPNRLNLGDIGDWILLLVICLQNPGGKLCGMPLLIISANQRRVNIVEGGIGKWWQMQAASRLLVGRHSILYHPFMCIWTTFLLHTFMFLFRPRIFTWFSHIFTVLNLMHLPWVPCPAVLLACSVRVCVKVSGVHTPLAVHDLSHAAAN